MKAYAYVGRAWLAPLLYSLETVLLSYLGNHHSPNLRAALSRNYVLKWVGETALSVLPLFSALLSLGLD